MTLAGKELELEQTLDALNVGMKFYSRMKKWPRVSTSQFDSLLYVHVKQLRSCRDGQLLNHTVPGQTSHGVYHYLVPILLPVTRNLFFLYR